MEASEGAFEEERGRAADTIDGMLSQLLKPVGPEQARMVWRMAVAVAEWLIQHEEVRP